VVGINKTSPSATATARVLMVTDVSDLYFTSSPYAIPEYAQRMDSPFTFERLTLGHQYYLYGAQMSTYSPALVMGTTWQGQVSAPTGHAVGNFLTGAGGAGPGLQTYTSPGNYSLVPVIDAAGRVLYYAEFQKVPGQPNWGKLVNSVPAQGGVIVQAMTGGGWNPLAPGAVAIRLTN
jgi:hypothetical protein